MEGDHCISTLEIAEIYFNTSPESFKQQAEKLFNSMDKDQDEKVSRTEFLNNMKDEGLLKAENPSEMFKALDVNGDGSLDLKEMMALYYVIKSGRPFCGGCGKFIPGMFFTCLFCFENEDGKFCICPKCFSNENYNHKHMPDHFLDNFALLEFKRTTAMAARKPPPPPEEPKKKSGLLRLFESQTMRKVFGAAAVASTEVAVTATTAVAVDPDNCSIL